MVRMRSVTVPFVALDENGKPHEVPRLDIRSEEEQLAFEEGKKRYLKHKRK